MADSNLTKQALSSALKELMEDSPLKKSAFLTSVSGVT